MFEPVRQVLRGNVNQKLPSPPVCQVKLLLLSSHSDFEDERECIWQEVVPDIQHYCLQYGAEFILIDAHHGFESSLGCFDDPISPAAHSLPLLFEEIQSARSNSVGCFLVCLIGDKYAACPLPVSIKTEEYTHIQTAAFEAGEDVKLLDEWYRLDQNGLSPSYQLRTSNSYLRKKSITSKQFAQLQKAIQKGAKIAHTEGYINQVSQKSQLRFYTSWLEQCVWEGLVNKELIARSLCVLRRFEKLPATSTTYGSDNSGTDDWKPAEHLVKFKNQLSSMLDKPNQEVFVVSFPKSEKEWPHSKEHSKYIEQFTPHVTYKIKQLIDCGFTNADKQAPTLPDAWANRLYNEALFHADYCIQHKSPVFQGRKEILNKIVEICNGFPSRRANAIAIKGDDGSGKTALLCEIAHTLSSCLTDSVVVLRFLGAAPTCSMTHELLNGICSQIAICYELESPQTNHQILTVDKLSGWFQRCLDSTSTTKQPLVILLDDLHLLKLGHSGAKNLCWIPSQLPPNVIIIFSISVQCDVESLPIKQLDSAQVFELSPLTDKVLVEISKSYMAAQERTLTVEQLALLQQCLKQSPSPLFAVLLAHEALSWPSYSPPNGTNSVPNTLSAFIEHLLEKLEKKYERETIAAICSYLECTQNGLTEGELLDLLSCNREVMSTFGNEPNTRRFPSMQWIRIKHDFASLLEKVLIDGHSILRWRNYATRIVVKSRYLQTSLLRKRFHSDIADMFSNVWADAQNPMSTDSKVGHLVMPRPLKFYAGDLTVYNVRRAREVWFHLLHSGNLETLKENALCQFEWLETLLMGAGLPHLLSVLEQAQYQLLNPDLHILFHQVLLPALPSLAHDPLLLATEFICRLRYMKSRGLLITFCYAGQFGYLEMEMTGPKEVSSHYLNVLVEQAMSWVDNYCQKPLLVPLTTWIKPPKCPLALTTHLSQWGNGPTIILPTLNYQHLLVAGNAVEQGVIRMYHIASQTMVRSFPAHSERITCMSLSRNGQFFASGSKDKTVKTWDLIHGSCIRTLSHHLDKVLSLILTKDDKRVISGSADQTAKMIDLESGKVLKTYDQQTGPVCDMALTESNEYLVTGCGDFYVRLYEVETGWQVWQSSGLMAPVTCLALTSNDAFLLVACEDETLRVFSLCSTTELHELRGHEGKICSLAIASDDCQVFAGSSDGNIYCYDLHLQTKALLETRNCHNATVMLKVSSDSKFLVSSSGDILHVWNVESRKCRELMRPDETANHITAAVLSRDCKYVVYGTAQSNVEMWDLEACVMLWCSTHNPKQAVTALHFTADSQNLLSGTDGGMICLWHLGNGSLLRQYLGHRAKICALHTFSDSTRVVSHDGSDTVHIWPLVDLSQLNLHSSSGALANVHGDEALLFRGAREISVLASNDRDFIARAADTEKEARIWSLNADGVYVRGKLSHGDTVTCLAISVDCRLAVTGSKDQSLKIWELATSFLTQVLVGHNDTVLCCAISSDSRMVISGAEDCAVICWDVETGSAVCTFSMHTQPVTAVAFTIDASVGFSGSRDGWILVWRISPSHGRLIASLNAQVAVQQILCSPDGSRVVVLPERLPHLPILCLHNSPASLVPISTMAGRHVPRHPSISSGGSSISIGSAVGNSVGNTATALALGSQQEKSQHSTLATSTTAATITSKSAKNGGSKVSTQQPAERKSSKVFAMLERSRSRASLADHGSSSKAAQSLPVEAAADSSSAVSAATKTNISSKVCCIT